MKNLSQETYDRITNQLRRSSGPGDRWADRRIAAQDSRDLLEAYEAAIALLDRILGECAYPSPLEPEVAEFLYLDNGNPRVELDNGGH